MYVGIVLSAGVAAVLESEQGRVRNEVLDQEKGVGERHYVISPGVHQ